MDKIIKIQVGVTALSGPQGVGKTTICASLNAITCSLDDFYFTNAELKEKGVFQRGLPGSHDLQMLLNVINEYKKGKDLILPVYDKSLLNGRGDRSGYKKVK